LTFYFLGFGSSETSALLKNRKNPNSNLNAPVEKGVTLKVMIIASVVMFILGFILTK
jgi:hypothetical protein